MDTAGRIFELLKTTGMEQKKFASLVGVSPQKVSEWKSGKAKSYTRRIPQIAEVLGTTSEYLLTGNGPKYRNRSDLFVDVSGSMGKKEPAPMNEDGLSEAKRRLWEAVDGLTDEQCEKLLGIVLEAKRLL